MTATAPTKETILVVDDEASIRRILETRLSMIGYNVITACDGTEALELFPNCSPDLVVLDVMMPKLDGYGVCQELRKESDVPIVMLTALGDVADRITGLELGADDYVCKPFSPRELVARIKTILRRVQRGGGVPESALHIDAAAYAATLRGQRLDLTPVEFRLLAALAGAPGRILSRSNLLEQIYDDHRIVTDRTVDTHIKNLRRKMEQVSPGTEMIHSVYGVGYRLDA